MATLLKGIVVLDLEPHILALIGATSMASGTLLVVWGASRLGAKNNSEQGESFLAPTLAVDALDPDLRVAYMQTLVLDARCQARFGNAQADLWSPLGREIRRTLIYSQAQRHKGIATDIPVRVDQILLDANAHIDDGLSLDSGWEQWVESIREART